MRILICDDEHIIIEKIKEYLQGYFTHKGYETPEITSFSDGDALLADNGQKDIVFLDIEMPGADGILVGRELKKANPDTLIFIITSHMQYLDDAMRFQVFRYLSKPLEQKRLSENMDDAMECYHHLVSSVIIDDGNTSIKVSESDIVYIEAQTRATLVHTVSDVFPAKRSISSWMEILNAGSFFQSHKSYIINMKYVAEFNHETITFRAEYGNAYLSRRKYKAFKKAYYIYLDYNR